MFVNQTLLTGEFYPVQKQAADNGDPAIQISEAANAALAAKPPPTSFEIGLHQFSMLILLQRL